MSQYQDRWQDGRLLEAGVRDCESRYLDIRHILASIGGPFTALDLGAHLGYFSVRMAEDFDASVAAVDPHRDLPKIASDRIRVRNELVNARDLRAMPRHDVVLALSVLHHFPNWKQVLNEVMACRKWAIVEVPHPDEKWMRAAPARDQLPLMHSTVKSLATTKLGDYERIGRDGSRHMRPMYLIHGTVQQLRGTVFSGSGSNSRIMPGYSKGLDDVLGYMPYPGSLNLRLGQAMDWDKPVVKWIGSNGSRTRDYQMWPAWIGDLPCHAMQPGRRGHGSDCVEILAPVRLRDQHRLGDGDPVAVDVEFRR